MTRFSSFAQTLQASDIAELLALTEKPEVISFAGGLPAPELFPIEEMKKVDEAIYNEEGRKAVQYGTTEGYVPLREEICKRMKDKFFVDCKPCRRHDRFAASLVYFGSNFGRQGSDDFDGKPVLHGRYHGL